MANPQFKKGMKFSCKEILQEAIREYGIKSRHDVRFKRVDKDRMHGFKNRNVTYKWLAKTYFEKWKADTTFSIRSLQHDVQETYSYQISLSKFLRAKNCTLETVTGNHKAQYSKIYDYLAEIRTSNPGSTTLFHLDNRLFRRMYIKNYYGGFLLSTVGVDGNDSFYPICYAIVEAENESSWHWFLSLMMTDLEMTNSYHFTFMSDKQKGLIKVLLELFPHAQDRKCVRHLYSNFKKGLIEVLLELFPHAQDRKCMRHLYSNFKKVHGFKGRT
ncbi:hypothetical protein V6N13_124258 [Hibiscus sabdariffa]